MNKYKIEIKGKLGIINILCILLLLIGILFLVGIEYIHNQNDGVKEIVTNWEEPQTTWNAFDIVIFPMLVGIYFAFTVRKKVIVDMEISIKKDQINVKYLNKEYTINMSNVKNIIFTNNKEDDRYLLSFVGNKEMVISNKNKSYDKYEIIFINDISKLCEEIFKITNHEIK